MKLVFLQDGTWCTIEQENGFHKDKELDTQHKFEMGNESKL